MPSLIRFSGFSTAQTPQTISRSLRFGSDLPGNIQDFESCLDQITQTFQNLSQPKLGGSDKDGDYPYVNFIHGNKLYTLRSLGVAKPSRSPFPRLMTKSGEFSVQQSNDWTTYRYFKDKKFYTVVVPNETPISPSIPTKLARLWQKLEKEVWDRA